MYMFYFSKAYLPPEGGVKLGYGVEASLAKLSTLDQDIPSIEDFMIYDIISGTE
jgi:hypothetical protein